MATKQVTTKKSKEEKIAETKMQVSAAVMSAAASEKFATGMFPDMSMSLLINQLEAKINSVQNGDMQEMEAMLVGQAQALQTMFVSLGRRAVAQTQLKPYGMYLTLALKAQSQSRATIQALTELKYPKQATFVKQANITTGNQQINNGLHDPAHAKEKTTDTNKLLVEVNYGSETMDGRAAQTTITKDKAMAAVGT